MIPEELHLRHFLSHRASDLDFRGVHLASLVGDNGAGKSALLDAITWVVWGRSRAPYGHDDDLTYHGETTMEVEYIFRMPYQGGEEHRCRILRRRERRGRRSVSSTLDFQVAGENGWKSLTADSIRDTQARIIAHLGLDYDTFINSAYLRQGHADEFTVQTPSDRKRVLSAILGLERWATYQDRVKKRRSSVQGQLQQVDARLAETEQELARRPEYAATLADATATADVAAQQLQAIQTQMDAINRVQEQSFALQRQIGDLDRRIQQEQVRLDEQLREQNAHEGQLNYYQTLVEQADTIDDNYVAYQQAVVNERAWGEKLSQAAQLQADKARHEQSIATVRESLNADWRKAEQTVAHLERTIATARTALERELSDLHGQRASLAERLASPELRAQLTTAQADLAQLGEIATALEAARQTAHAADVEVSQRTERNRQLREAMTETKTRLDALAAAEADCPLCGQTLTPEHHQQLLHEIETAGTAMGDEYRANQARVQTLQEQANTLHNEIQQHEQSLRRRPRQEQTVARLQQQMEQDATARERTAVLEAQSAALEQRLATSDYATTEQEALLTAQQHCINVQSQLDANGYAPDARAALQQTLEALAEVGYDAVAHQSLKTRISELSGAEDDFRELEKARISVEKETETLKRLALEIEAQQQRVQQVQTERATQQSALDALQPQLARATALGQQLSAARNTEALARQRVGAARQNLAALDTLARRLIHQREERDGLAQRGGLLTELREAFGVNGIPAMIIEHTLPELEREANRILQRLTSGRMHIRFETQRETKTGNVRETLDIIISDEKGTRPYENFSGGEQFRVNFSIRVALSRMLAQRAGVRLRSLFVDEGFGALDAEGRQRLVEAVKAVQNEFDLILVITHIAELRDVFPTQIQVVKAESGSLVTM